MQAKLCSEEKSDSREDISGENFAQHFDERTSDQLTTAASVYTPRRPGLTKDDTILSGACARPSDTLPYGTPHNPFDEHTAPNTLVTAQADDSHWVRVPCLLVMAGELPGCSHRILSKGLVVGRDTTCTIALKTPDASRFHCLLTLDDDDFVYLEDLGSANGTFVNGRRISERFRLQGGDKIQVGEGFVAALQYRDRIDEDFYTRQAERATRDPMTGCFNRAFILDRLQGETAFAARNHMPLSLAIIDIDHFKRINDSHGHPAGDSVLCHAANNLRRAVRAEDVLARIGGEEFLLLLPNTDLLGANNLCERLRTDLMSSPCKVEKKFITVTASFGIATQGLRERVSAEELMGRADASLYAAKDRGRNTIVCHFGKALRGNSRLSSLETALRRDIGKEPA